MAQGMVTSELLSSSQFPVIRENTGNFRDSGLGVFGSAVSRQPSGFIGVFEQIPYATEPGIF
jgi:hypothetical protein